VNPLSSEIIVETLGHNKYSKEQVFIMERKVLEAITFKIPKSTLIEEVIIKKKCI
jgi:hypothetical protein